jgi:hypothetical protein
VILVVIIYILKNPEKAEKWYSILAQVFSFVSKRAELRHVASDIQADLNRSKKEVNYKASEVVIPYGVRIEWATDVDREAFVTSDELVVRMRYHKNQARNFLYATLNYVEEGLYPSARPHVDKVVLKATQYHLVRKIMTRRNRQSSLQIFYDEVYEPEKARQPTLETYFKAMDSIDENGLFEPILLREFQELGLEMLNRNPNTEIMKETKDFVDFVHALSTKEPDVDVPMIFSGERIRVLVPLVDANIYLQQGIKLYVDEILKQRDKARVKSVYLCGMGPIPVLAAREIVTGLEKAGAFRRIGETEREFTFHKSLRKGICATLECT